MIEQIATLLIVLALIWIVIFQKREKKLDFMQFFMDDKSNLSFMRFGSFVCLWLFVYMVKRSIGAETVNIEIILMVGAAAFFPKLLQKFVEKYTGKNEDKK